MATPVRVRSHSERHAKRKMPELTAALEGRRMSDHHRRMIHHSLKHWAFLEQELLALDEEIWQPMETSGW